MNNDLSAGMKPCQCYMIDIIILHVLICELVQYATFAPLYDLSTRILTMALHNCDIEYVAYLPYIESLSFFFLFFLDGLVSLYNMQVLFLDMRLVDSCVIFLLSPTQTNHMANAIRHA